MIHDSVLDLIGRTPVVRLNRIPVPNGCEILIKLESYNPGSSIKDRSALFMLDQAERSGELRPGMTIVESTSGNLGKALALIGAARGYRVLLVVDPKVPESVLDFVKALGAGIELVDIPDADGGYQGNRIKRVRELTERDPDLFWPDQYNNPNNPRVHAEYTAREILDDISQFDVLVATVSTGGHLSGLSRTLKAHLPGLVSIGVDAFGSAAFGFPFHKYFMRGLGLAWKPGNLDYSLVDRIHQVADHEGIAASRMLALHEGILIGESAGAAMFSALHHAYESQGRRIVVIAADDGVNYLRESFGDLWLKERGLLSLMREQRLDDLSGLVQAAKLPTHPPVGPEREPQEYLLAQT